MYLEPRPPGIAPQALERTDNAAGDQLAFIGRDVGEKVQPDREVEVGGIEIHQVVCAPGQNVIQRIVRQIAVWINELDAMAGSDTLHDEFDQQGCFPGAGLSDALVYLQTDRFHCENQGETVPSNSRGGRVTRRKPRSQWTTTHSWSRSVRSLCGLILCSSVSE